MSEEVAVLIEPQEQVEPTTKEDRFSRQAEAVPPDTTWPPIVIVGVGAIGRQVALQAVAIGAPHLVFYDFDEVDLSNVTTQMYRIGDVGKAKVFALRDDIEHLFGNEAKLRPMNSQFNARWLQENPDAVVFSCVDNMTARLRVAEACRRIGSPLLIDGRMALENIRVVTMNGPEDFNRYRSSLTSENATVQTRCTTGSTVYTANCAAALMVHELTRYLRGVPCNEDFLLSLKDNAMMPTPR